MTFLKLADLLTNRRFTHQVFRGALLIVLIAIAVIFGLFNTEKLLAVLNTLTSVFYPFFLGICIAFVLNVILKMYEEHVFAFLNRKNYKLWNRCRRMVCIALTYLTVLAIFTGVVFFVIPELFFSLQNFLGNIPSYLRNGGIWLTQQLDKFEIDTSQIDLLNIDWPSIITQASQMASDIMGNLYNTTLSIATSIATGMFTLVMSMIFSIYMLSQKEHLLRGVRRIL